MLRFDDVLRCVAVCYSVLRYVVFGPRRLERMCLGFLMCCSMLKCVAVCCSVLPCVVVHCGMLYFGLDAFGQCPQVC